MKKLIIIFSAVAGLATTGCKKGFLDINNNPNQPVESNITPNLVLSNALNQTAARVTTGFGFAHHWFGYWAPSGSFSSNTVETTYNITTGFQTAQWTGMYDNLYDYHFMQLKAEATGQDFYTGIAKIMKSFIFARLVDLYGNIPYSKAFDQVGNIKPAYDNAATIYADLQIQIQQGISLIKNADISANIKIAAADIMFAGDKTKWGKFGNTLALRLLIHQSQVSGFNPAASVAAINANGYGFLESGENADVNPGYLTDKPANFWAAYLFKLDGTYSNTFERANNFVLSEMQGLGDNRIPYYFKPVRSSAFPAGTFRGVDYGLPPQTSNSEDRLSDIGGADVPSGGTPKGIGKSYNMRQWIITSIESLFLQAEAIQRGWIAGNAQTMYENAVRETYIWLNVPDPATAASNYFSNNAGSSKVDWAAASNKITLIAWQKYFALCGIEALETWTDKRRLNVIPVPLSAAPGTTASTLPIRLIYPQAEYDLNTENVSAQGTINQFSSKIFWMP